MSIICQSYLPYYYREVEKIMECFASEEGLSFRDLVSKIQIAAEQSEGAEKNMLMLLASSNFNKFVKFMKSRAEQAAEKERREAK
jgi:hypothetical protein